MSNVAQKLRLRASEGRARKLAAQAEDDRLKREHTKKCLADARAYIPEFYRDILCPLMDAISDDGGIELLEHQLPQIMDIVHEDLKSFLERMGFEVNGDRKQCDASGVYRMHFTISWGNA